MLERFEWLVGSPSSGSLYPALHALLKDELVTVEVVSGEENPSRKVYSITKAGQKALKKWIASVDSSTSLKAFVMRLALASNFTENVLAAQLRQRRAQVASDQADLKEQIRAIADGANPKRHLALDYGLTLAIAELTWLDRTLDRFSRKSRAAEDGRGN